MKPEAKICPRCDGTGWVVETVEDGAAEITERCPVCGGDGFVYEPEPEAANG